MLKASRAGLIESLESSVLWEQKTNPVACYANHNLLFSLLVDLSQQEMVKMALEPQWEAQAFLHSYAFRPGRDQHDALEQLHASLSTRAQFIANINLSKSLLRLDCKYLLREFKTHPIIIRKVSRWIESGLIAEYCYQSCSFDNKIFALPNGAILAPLLVNLIFNHIQLSIHESSIRHTGSIQKSRIICYGLHCMIISESVASINNCIQILTKWLRKYGSNLNKRDFDIKFTSHRFNFLNYGLIFNNNKKVCEIGPSVHAIKSFNQKNRELIQLLKVGPIKKFISRLRINILDWATDYAQYNSKNTFNHIDKVLFSQLRAVTLKRHPGKSKNWIKKKYFPSQKLYFFQNRYYVASWVLTDTTSLSGEFLPRLQWIRRKHYVKVVSTKSVYDNDYTYWKKRL